MDHVDLMSCRACRFTGRLQASFSIDTHTPGPGKGIHVSSRDENKAIQNTPSIGSGDRCTQLGYKTTSDDDGRQETPSYVNVVHSLPYDSSKNGCDVLGRSHEIDRIPNMKRPS